MPLGPGARLGPYEIVAKLGAGGMGEVWRARDARLDRTVAIKVLNADLAATADLRERFEREARAVSSFSHPHICALYDVGREGDVEFLVMEHIEGETLAAHLLAGPLPLDLALRTAIEIASALDAAHRQGVVHRDLKPGNVMLTKSGAKLLDFGLARKIGALGPRTGSAIFHETPLTQEGTILGTIQYMAPEQLHGRDADARSDLFAFGAMLYEMISGARAFPGDSQASVIAAILERTPAPLAERQPLASPALQRAVSRCLEKEPDDRWQSARDLMHELEWIASSSESGAGTVAPRRGSTWPAWSLAAAAVLAAVALWIRGSRGPEVPRRGPLQLELTRPPSAPYVFFDQCAVSPDGRRVAFTAYGEASKSRIWLRDLDAAEAHPIPGTEGGEQSFWSPDSRSLAFRVGQELWRVDLAGGPAVKLAQRVSANGGAWSADGTILFADERTWALQRVSASGGPSVPVTKLGPRDEGHRWPSFLPDGRHFVYLADSWRTEDHHIRLASLDAPGQDVDLFDAVSKIVFVEPGWLLYVRGSNLLAQAFDTGALRLEGGPIPIAGHVSEIGQNHEFEFSASRDGVLCFSKVDPRAYLAWTDRSGRVLTKCGEPQVYGQVALSADQKRVAFGSVDADGRAADLWILELARGTSTRLTFDPAGDFAPVWSPSGDRIAFTSMRTGVGDVYVVSTDAPGSEERVAGFETSSEPSCFSTDGALVYFDAEGKDSGADLWSASAEGRAEPSHVLATPANESGARFSPDGNWLACVSDESGRSEVYIHAWPLTGRRWQVSTHGGTRPWWRPDGAEIFWRSLDREVLAAKLSFGDEVEIATPEVLPISRSQDLIGASRDGARLLLLVPVEDWLQAPLTVIVDWTETLPKHDRRL
ncbi:MAG TPA: protein kinase [Planctomycetota bacterium]|jgi:Tol biopolymer transport system component|nr:protein kinase [Planctomycetota bacterium]